MARTRTKRQQGTADSNGNAAHKNEQRQTWFFQHPDPIVRFSGWVALVTFFLLITALIQARITQGQLSVMQAEQRPWLEITRITPVESANRNGLNYFDIGITVKNVGRAPAHDVEAVAHIIPSKGGEWRSSVQEICMKQRAELGTFIPDQSFTVMPNGQLDVGSKGETIHASDLQLDPHVVGCTFYRWRNDVNSIHQMGFVAPLQRTDNGSLVPKAIYMVSHH